MQADKKEGRWGDVLPRLAAAERDELSLLRRDNKKLLVERDILSKTRGLVCTGDRRGAVKLFRFMTENWADFSVDTVVRILRVSKAGFHVWRHRPPSLDALAGAALLKRFRTVHASSCQTYGAPRVHAALRTRASNTAANGSRG